MLFLDSVYHLFAPWNEEKIWHLIVRSCIWISDTWICLIIKELHTFPRNLNLVIMGMIPSLTWAPVSKCVAGWSNVDFWLLFTLSQPFAKGNILLRNPLFCSSVVSVSAHWDQCWCLLAFYHWHLLGKVIQGCWIQKYLIFLFGPTSFPDSKISSVSLENILLVVYHSLWSYNYF